MYLFKPLQCEKCSSCLNENLPIVGVPCRKENVHCTGDGSILNENISLNKL